MPLKLYGSLSIAASHSTIYWCILICCTYILLHFSWDKIKCLLFIQCLSIKIKNTEAEKLTVWSPYIAELIFPLLNKRSATKWSFCNELTLFTAMIDILTNLKEYTSIILNKYHQGHGKTCLKSIHMLLLPLFQHIMS